MAKEISKVVKLQVKEVLQIHRHRLDLLGAAGVYHEFSNSMQNSRQNRQNSPVQITV
jgi:hypothetical protein